MIMTVILVFFSQKIGREVAKYREYGKQLDAIRESVPNNLIGRMSEKKTTRF